MGRFDSTPNLESSPEPILFVPFNNNEIKCNHCKREYSITLLYKQRYCKYCFFWYVMNNKMHLYLDVHLVRNNNTQCIEHETIKNTVFYEYCFEVLFFKQISTIDANGSVYYKSDYKIVES